MLSAALLPRCDQPFSFFGHSVGALIAFELARQLRREHGLLPDCLFVAAHRAPRLLFSGRLARTLSDAELLVRLSALGGTPPELLRQPELLLHRSEALKADFTLSQTYAYRPEPPLACPILAFGGMADQEVTMDQLEPWRDETVAEFRLRRLPGEHFFLHSAQPLLLGILAHELRALMAAVALTARETAR
jgi:medium-chain acyl-[acyl-carrier-protein] hydrolase